MAAATQDMSAIIADEIVEHNKGKPSTSGSSAMQEARFEGLVQLVTAVLTALEQAEMGRIEPNPRPGEHLQRVFTFGAGRYSDFRLAVRIDAYGLDFFRGTWLGYEPNPLEVATELFWDPLHRRWVGPRLLERDHSKAGAPRVRESPEAVVTRAILNALDAATPENP